MSDEGLERYVWNTSCLFPSLSSHQAGAARERKKEKSAGEAPSAN